MAELEGMQLGTCRILRRLRRGGMGDVYLAEQPSLGRQVVVKVIHGAGREDPQALASPEAREQSARQFAQEARAIATLDHPHILPLYEYGEQDGIHYLVMPYVEHGSLADLLQPASPGASGALALPLPAAFVADIIAQTAEALQFAHHHGIIHRDVKPGNLLIRLLSSAPALVAAPGAGQTQTVAREAEAGAANEDRDAIQSLANTRAHVLLADFGLARFLSGLNPNTGTTGTPLYSAPEHYAGHPVPATDQYALACVTYYLLAGQPVFSGTVAELYHQHMSVDPPPVTRINPLLPPAVDTVVVRALAKDPAQRYPQILDYARALGSALDPMTSLSRPLWPARSLTAGVAAGAAAITSESADTAGRGGHQAPPLPPRYASQARDGESSPDGQLHMRSPVSADGLTEPASGVPAPRQAAIPGEWPSPGESAAATSGQAPARRSAYPDAPGSPIPRRWRRKRPLMLLALGLLLLAALAGVGWRVALRYIAETQLAAHAVTITRSGSLSLGSAPAASSAKNSAPLLVRTRWTADEAAAIATAAQHITGLPSLSPVPALPATTISNQQVMAGPGQAETGAAHPGQVSVASDDHTLIVAVDSTLQIAPIQPGQAPGKPRVIAMASLVAPVLRQGDTLGEPRVLLDSASRRWAIVVAELQPASSPAGAVAAGFFDLAISDAADPLGRWHVYQFASAVAAVPGCNWADDPQLGNNDASFVLTGNSFACGAAGAFQGAALWDLPKDTFLHGTPTQVYAFFGFANVQRRPVFTLTPAMQTDAGTTGGTAAGEGLQGMQWLVSTDASYADRGQTSSRVIVWAFAQPGQESSGVVPTLTGVVLTLPYPYADPPTVATGNGADDSAHVRVGDAHPTQAQVSGGHLYTAFTTAANWTGSAATGTGIYWLDIVPQPFSAHSSGQQVPSLRVNQAGIFGLAGADVFAPALVASAAGDLALVAAASSSGSAHLVFALRAHGDPPGTFGQHVLGPLTTSAPLFSDGQGGAALAASAETLPPGHSIALWAAGVVTNGSGQPWQTQLWHVSGEGGG